MLLAVILTGCGGSGGSGGEVVACEVLKNWRQGESVVYRFTDSASEWLVQVNILELRPGFLKYETFEDQVDGESFSHGTTESTWEGGCPTSLVFIGSEREKLVMGQHSAWGTFGVTQDFQSVQEVSCESATRTTNEGTFPVERCLNYGLLGPAEPIHDEFHIGSGSIPGGGFIAREVTDSAGNEALAILESWNGR